MFTLPEEAMMLATALEVQKLLGHHDPKVTMRYAHLSPGVLIEATNIVGNLVGRRPVVAMNPGQSVAVAEA